MAGTFSKYPNLYANESLTSQSSITSTTDITAGDDLIATDDVTVGGELIQQVQTSVTAYSGGGQANAVAITKTITEISSAAAHGDSVKLPVTVAGTSWIVYNNSSQQKDIAVYPPTDGTISQQAANTPIYVAYGSTQTFDAVGPIDFRRRSKGYRYVTTGDLSSNHFTHADLTMDNTWRDLSLTSIIPPSAYGKPVHIKMFLTDNTVNAAIRLRPKGNSNAINAFSVQTQVATTPSLVDHGMIETNSNGVIQYLATESLSTVGIHIMGYWVES